MMKKSNEKNQNTKQKSFLMLISFVLIVLMSAGTVIAFLMDNTNEVINTFVPVSVDSRVDEDSFDGNVKSGVKITNVVDKGTEGIEAYIRAKIVITWQDGEGNLAPVVPKKDTDYTIDMGDAVDGGSDGKTEITWIKKDGFYYYVKPVEPDESTAELITELEQTASEEGYNLHVEILSEAIQAVPTSVVEEAWGITVGSDGKLNLTSTSTTTQTN